MVGGVVVETLPCITRRTEAENACDQNAKCKNRENVYGTQKLNQGIETSMDR
jgi:hypothetical protein